MHGCEELTFGSTILFLRFAAPAEGISGGICHWPLKDKSTLIGIGVIGGPCLLSSAGNSNNPIQNPA